MPEGPHVFIKAASLRPKLIGKKLLHINMLDEKIVVNADINTVSTKGKKLWLELSNDMAVLFSFGLEGDIVSHGGSTGTIAELVFEDSIKYYLFDPIRIAKCVYCNLEKLKFLLPQGVDPLQELYGMREWLNICHENYGKLIAKFIYDQNIIAGIGNMFRSEILHVAKIDPKMKIKDINDDKLEYLLVTIYRVLGAATKEKYTIQIHGKAFDLSGKPVVKVKVKDGLYVWSTIVNTVNVHNEKVNLSPRKKSTLIYVNE